MDFVPFLPFPHLVSYMEDVNNKRSRDGGGEPALFVVKTYRMVDDPVTDSVIAWGKENNSFVVVDPFAFSRHLLPFHFKHSNFASFVRQLNIYGFRKVDPDRWEFAHALFLRGHTHLLHHIIRRNKSSSKKTKEELDLLEEKEETKRVALLVAKLQEKQRATDEEVQQMWRRMKEIEARTRQLTVFFSKVTEDPLLLQGLAAVAPIGGDGGAECWLGSGKVHGGPAQLVSNFTGREMNGAAGAYYPFSSELKYI